MFPITKGRIADAAADCYDGELSCFIEPFIVTTQTHAWHDAYDVRVNWDSVPSCSVDMLKQNDLPARF